MGESNGQFLIAAEQGHARLSQQLSDVLFFVFIG